MPELVINPSDVWSKATPLQLLRWMKLLGVEQQVIAARVAVAASTVSMWLTGQRGIPAKYRPALVEWAGVTFSEALNRHHKDVATLPTEALKRAAIEAFHAPINRWTLEVWYEAGVLRERLNATIDQLTEYKAKDALTLSDLRSMKSIAHVLQTQMHNLEDLETPPDESQPPPPDERDGE